MKRKLNRRNESEEKLDDLQDRDEVNVKELRHNSEKVQVKRMKEESQEKVDHERKSVKSKKKPG